MMWQPRSCCCCFSVRIGTLIIGWISVVVYILPLLCSLKFVTTKYEEFKTACAHMSEYSPMDPDDCAVLVMFVIIFAGLVSGLGLLISILLIAGVNKRKSKWIIPFLVCQVLGFGLSIFLFVLALGIFIYHLHGLFCLFIILVFVPEILICFYVVAIVFACYKEIERQNGRGADSGEVPYVEQEDLIPKFEMECHSDR